VAYSALRRCRSPISAPPGVGILAWGAGHIAAGSRVGSSSWRASPAAAPLPTRSQAAPDGARRSPPRSFRQLGHVATSPSRMSPPGGRGPLRRSCETRSATYRQPQTRGAGGDNRFARFHRAGRPDSGWECPNVAVCSGCAAGELAEAAHGRHAHQPEQLQGHPDQPLVHERAGKRVRRGFRTLAGGLRGLLVVLAPIVWLWTVLSSLAEQPPRGMDLGWGEQQPERLGSSLLPESEPVRAPARSGEERARNRRPRRRLRIIVWYERRRRERRLAAADAAAAKVSVSAPLPSGALVLRSRPRRRLRIVVWIKRRKRQRQETREQLAMARTACPKPRRSRARVWGNVARGCEFGHVAEPSPPETSKPETSKLDGASS